MGLLLWSVALVWFLIIGGIQSQQTTDAATLSAQMEASTLARQMLMTANAIGLWRHEHPGQSVPDLSQLPGLSFTPDSRIRWQVEQARLWVWTPEQPGLMAALLAHSRHSQLLGIAHKGRFILADGQDSGLSLPSAVPDSALVYLN